jgi:deazaflavin-dependent oxidoreductase (nitroreductase family)
LAHKFLAKTFDIETTLLCFHEVSHTVAAISKTKVGFRFRAPKARRYTLRARLLRVALWLPTWLYRAHLGWLLGNRFLMLTHIGRKSGLPRRVVLEVVRHDKATDTYIIASGWGENADWLRNIQQTPAVIITTGCRRMAARAMRLSVDEAERELRDYARRHPIPFRTLVCLLVGQHVKETEENFQFLAQSLPVVALLPGLVERTGEPVSY